MIYALAAVTHDQWMLRWTAIAAIGTTLGALASGFAAYTAVRIADRARTEATFLRLQRQRDEALRLDISPVSASERTVNGQQLIQWRFNVSNPASTAIRSVGGHVTADGAYTVMPVNVIPAGSHGYIMATEWAPPHTDEWGQTATVTLWFQDSSGTWWEMRDAWADVRNGPGPYLPNLRA